MATTSDNARPEAPRLPDTLRLGPVELTVSSLDRSLPFYTDTLGLTLGRRDGDRAALGAGGDEDLVVLVEDPDARPAGRHAGLYHVALLHPSRHELARAVRRLLETRTPIHGASDHGISEAIYLPDPDGNQIELAADRPRERWGDLRDPAAIAPNPLDLDGLLRAVADEPPPGPADPALVVGHVHLHVGDIEQALRFYRDVIGFEPQTEFPTAAFISAGGYHHHLAVNTWRGEGVPPPPSHVVGLREWTIVLDDEDAVEAIRRRAEAADDVPEGGEGGELVLRDPWGIPVRVVAESASA